MRNAHFLMMRDKFSMGGIETLICRLARKLLQDGHRVTILTKFLPDQEIGIPDGVNVVVLPRFFFLLVPFYAKWYTKRYLADVEAIPCFDRVSLCMAALISQHTRSRSGIACFAYSPWEMKPENLLKYRRGGDIFQLPCYWYDKCLPDSQKAFMSPQVRVAHEAAYQRTFGDSSIFPIPIFDGQARSRKALSQIRRGHFISIGRLSSSVKQYNFTVLDSIKALRSEGYPVTWDIYGSGDLLEAIHLRILDLGLQDAVSLKGTLDYDRFPEVLQDAHAFIGMGTAALEAAIIGVPTIVAHAATWEGTTHGFLHEQPFGILGEILKTQPSFQISQYLRQAILLNDIEYAAVSERDQHAAANYTFDRLMPLFYRLLEGTKQVKVSVLQFYLFAVACKLPQKRWPLTDRDFASAEV